MSSTPEVQNDASGVPRRASGRVRKQTEIYAPNGPVAGKRKRTALDTELAQRQMPDDYESDGDVPSEADDEDDAAVDEEMGEKSRRARKRVNNQGPTQKKAKLHTAPLPIRSANASHAVKRAPRKKNMPSNVDMAQAEGLFARVFASRESAEDVAGQWIQEFKVHESRALADVINFVLQSAGCHIRVKEEDVEDADSVSSRLTDIQEEFQATQPTDYPLIAKGRGAASFKSNMTAFIKALIKSIAATNLLYDNTALIENIEEWFSVMSAAADRAFRHSSTIASLAVVSALCEIGQENAQEAAVRQRQVETEQSKARPNKSRIKDMEQRTSESKKVLEFIEVQVRDWFMVIFMHRYRDVDQNIRRDCMAAFGEWVITLPEVFFDAKHLRYSGWLLCDDAPIIRTEVLTQLQNLYKQQSMIGGLRAFTERFRERLVEMTTSDADSNVRCQGVQLLTLLRENGLLEPEDIDAVGRLLYDTDPKVRKAVAGFFAEDVLELYKSKVDTLGGTDVLEEALPEINEGNFDAPRLSWLLYKSLAEMMVAYDPDEASSSGVDQNEGLLHLQTGPDSRFTLAADALYEHISEIQNWQEVSGYLLFDHSQRRASSRADDVASQLKQECILTNAEEIVLLRVVESVARTTVVDLGEKIAAAARFTKQQKDQLIEKQEEAARQIASVIPKLLRKFGDSPVAAVATFKIESVLNMPPIRNLPRNPKDFKDLMENTRKLFMSHTTDDVLSPARDAMLEARSHSELGDIVEENLVGLWEDVVANLVEITDVKIIPIRGSSDPEDSLALNSTLLRLALLSQKVDCVSALEDETTIESHGASTDEYRNPIDYAIGYIQRATPSTHATFDVASTTLEDQTATRAAEVAFLYMQWKFFGIKKAALSSSEPVMPYPDLEALATRRDALFDNMAEVLRTRNAADSICVTFTRLILELSTSAKSLLNLRKGAEANKDYELLAVDLQESTPKLIISVFSAAERQFAKLSKKKLESAPRSEEAEAEMDINADPVDEDDDDDIEVARKDNAGPVINGVDESHDKEGRLKQILVAERTLCELTKTIIFAVHAGFLDAVATRRRIERNKARLGPNFKELITYFDVEKVARTVAGKTGKGKSRPVVKNVGKVNGSSKAAKEKAHPKSNAIVADDEVDDEIEDDEDLDMDDDNDDHDTLKRRGLVMDGVGEGVGEEEDADEPIDPADGDQESVLGD